MSSPRERFFRIAACATSIGAGFGGEVLGLVYGSNVAEDAFNNHVKLNYNPYLRYGAVGAAIGVMTPILVYTAGWAGYQVYRVVKFHIEKHKLMSAHTADMEARVSLLDDQEDINRHQEEAKLVDAIVIEDDVVAEVQAEAAQPSKSCFATLKSYVPSFSVFKSKSVISANEMDNAEQNRLYPI